MGTPRYEKPAILERIPRDRSAVIEASAGTGKTYTLEHLVVELLLEAGARIEEVLVVTFTERATAELRARVRKKLEQLLAWTDEAEGVPDARCWTLGPEARRRIEAALTSLDAATISTIHGFCQRVLSEQAFVNGRLFGEKQVDAREAFGAAFRDELRTRLAREPALRTMLEQWLREVGDLEALEALLYRCSTERGELCPTFDGRALLGAVRECPLSGDGLRQLEAELVQAKVNARTRNSLCEKLESLATWCAERQGREDAVGVLAEFQAWRGSGKSGPAGYLGEKLPDLTGPLGRRTWLWFRALLSRAPSFSAAVVHAMLPGVRERLAARKRELGLIDFDDMLLLVRDGLRGPRGEALAQALRQRYRFALVDEFQDTDEVQWEVFRRVFHESGGASVLYVIGDPKQAIYSFRGADVQTYLQAREAVVDAGGAFVQLDTNFRSTRPVVDAVNHLLEQGAASPFFDGAIRYDAPVECGRTDFTAVGPDGAPVAPVHLWRFLGEGKLSAGGVRDALGQRMAQEIRTLLHAQPAPLVLQKDGETRRVRARDIFVLTRTESEGRELAQWLRAEGIPVAFFKQDGLFQSEEAQDVRDVLAAIAEPEDRSARMRAWMGPFFALSLDALAGVQELPATHPLMARLLSWKALADVRDYEQLFPRLLEESGVVRRELFLGASERRLTNYLHLFEVLLEEVGRARCSLPELVQLLQACIEERRLPPGENGNVQRLESEHDAVQFMTMHKSKGLEAPVVFLGGGFTRAPANDVSLLHRDGKRVAWVGSADEEVKALIEREQLEDDQRLLYVALTRAGARLYLPFFCELSEEERSAHGEEVSGAFSTLKGSYRVLNACLEARRSEGRAGAAEGFVQEDVWCRECAPQEVPEGVLARWEPPAALLEDVPQDTRVEALRRQHAGFLVTSYSRLSRLRTLAEDDAREDLGAVRDADWPVLPEEHLPAGVTTGLFLHEVLEKLPVAPVAEAEGFEAWAAREDMAVLLEEAAQRHGVEARYLPHAREVTWNAVRTPVVLPGGTVLPGVAHAARLLREVEFLYPIPEEAHPLLGRAGEGRFGIERGCVRGFIDLVLEHEGRVYFADWKSDLLPRYDVRSVSAHVTAHYAIQEQLYTLAVVRMLGIRSEEEYEARFGGSLYLFLRGMRVGEAGPEGVYAARVPWRQVVAWEEALLRQEEWGFGRVG